MSVVEVQVEDGVEKPATSQKWFTVRQVAWLRDGSGLVITAKEQASSPAQVWFIHHPDGEVRKITNDTIDYTDVSPTDDSSTLATIRTEYLTGIWIAPNGEAGRAQEIISAGRYNGSVSWTPDNKLIYASAASGNWEIWMMDADGGNQHQLTFDGHTNRFPTASADGRYVVFTSDRSSAPKTYGGWMLTGEI